MKNFIKYFIFISFIYYPFSNLYSQKDLEDLTNEQDLKQFIIINSPFEDAFIAVERLAAPYIDKKDWNGAIQILKKYSNRFPNMKIRFEKIIELLEAPSQNLMTTNISAVNTSGDEYFPVISIDGNKMYFTGADRKDCIGGEDIFLAEKINGEWQPARNMGPPLSTKEDDAINSISADGNILILFGNYKNAFGGGDNFFIEKTSTGWSQIKVFPKPVNSKYWDCDGFLTADGKAILFTSDRPEGVGEFHKGGQFFHGIYEGNTDIYVSLKNDSGWGQPINLGNIINTPYTERSPFLHPDGKTLYFSSDGHYGLGELDVFKSVRINDTSWTDWSEPVNLGKDINTSKFDIAYKITTDGKLAYFSSNRSGGKGGYDIYSITLPEEARPDRNVVTIKGKVTDENNTPLEADLKWFELPSNLNMGNLRSDPQNGEYLIVLPDGKKYNYYASKKGFYSISQDIDLSTELNYKEMEVNIKLVSLKYLSEQKTSIKLNNIYFDFNKYDIKPESFVELKRVHNFLTENPDIKIEISAFTDSIGSDDYNRVLSQKRAQSVVDYLISAGINSYRLVAIGYGKENPIAPNNTEEGRSLNRRVEMRILK